MAELQTIVDTRSPGGVVGDPRWRAYYRAHGRQADRYQVGRVFLAGDAAHVQSPAGGLGMNTGIQDAYNLAWKVGLVLQEGVSDAMLDSYHAERHRVGHEMLLLNDYLHQSLVGDMPDLPLPDALRRQLAIIRGGTGGDTASHGKRHCGAQHQLSSQPDRFTAPGSGAIA